MLKLFLWTGVMIIGLILCHFGYLDTNGKIILFIATVLNTTLVLNMDLYMDFKDIFLTFIFTIIISLLYAIAMII